MHEHQYYQCTLCQREHYDGDALFQQHLRWQSRHGLMYCSEATWAFARVNQAKGS